VSPHAGISSTDAEHEAAINRAAQIKSWLETTLGFPELIIADSGNGAHLLGRIDLPCSDEITTLLKKCIEAVALRFEDAAVSVDRTVYNAARIWKLYGTMACKGDDTPERPHRQAKIIKVPRPSTIIPLEKLQQLAAMAPAEPSRDIGDRQTFDIDAWIAHSRLDVATSGTLQDGRKWILSVCPWDGDHTNRSAYIIEQPSGAIAAGCHHNGCSGKGWHDLRDTIEPGWRENRSGSSNAIHIRENLNDGEVESVMCYAQEEIKSVPFPAEAWTGLFGHWRDEVGECTDAPLENLWGAFLLATGMIIGRNAWISNPRPLFPNIYLLLVGPSGSSRKSTVLWLARKLLEELNEDFKTLHGIVSTEGIIEPLSERAEMKALADTDEFRALLSVANRKGSQDLLPKLNSLYYCETTSVDRRKDPASAIKPFFSLMAATPIDYMDDLIGDRDIAGGFFNRFITICGDPRDAKARPKKISPEIWNIFKEPLMKLSLIDPREIDLDSDAEVLWDRWFKQWSLDHKKLAHREQLLTERIPEHALKAALIYSALNRESDISAGSLAIAIKVCGWLESNTRKIFQDIGLDRRSKAESIILRRLKSAKNHRMYTRDLQQYCGSLRITSTDFRDAIKVLKDTEQVSEYPQTVIGWGTEGRRAEITPLYA
jgi:hypothetical protein